MSAQHPVKGSQRSSVGVTGALAVSCAAAFVWISGRALPDIVASHFAASGIATGFLPRPLYLRLMLVVVVVLPLGMNFVAGLSLRDVDARINLPNSEYWLAPERRPESVAFLRRHLARFTTLLLVFFCYVHWLVVRANALSPPVLSSARFIAGLLVFLASAVIWATIFLRRFRAVPRSTSCGARVPGPHRGED